jgi:rhodanese-related sulfurtransferase
MSRLPGIVLVAAVLFVGTAIPVAADENEGEGPFANLPESKQTASGRYLISTQAYAMWKADPDRVKLIDVRTPEEYIYVGHPAMAFNVPLKFLDYQWDPERKKPVMRSNPDFLDQVQKILRADDTVLVICRSGQRSAPAADMLVEAGFENVYSVVDGVEGDKVADPENVFRGQRMKNGWKNSGLPWTYELDPKQMHLDP